MMRKQRISPLQIRVFFDSEKEAEAFMNNSDGVHVGTNWDIETPGQSSKQKEFDYDRNV